MAMEPLSARFKADKEVALTAVTQDGGAVRHLSAELKADKEVGLAAVTQNGWAIRHLSAGLKADKSIGVAAVTQNCLLIQHLSAKLKADKEVGLAAVTQDGRLIEHLSAELEADKEVVLAAVAQAGCAIHYASIDLQEYLTQLALCLGCDVQTVADGEVHPVVIQLDLSAADRDTSRAELICSNLAGSEVYRCLISDVEDLLELRHFVSSELLVPPSRLKFLRPDGSCFDMTKGLDTFQLMHQILAFHLQNGT